MPYSNSDINVNPLLSGFAQDYALNNGTLIARSLFPTQVVPSQKAKYAEYSKKNLYVPDDKIASYDGVAREAVAQAEKKDVNCQEHALVDGVDRHQNQNREGPFAVAERQAVQRVVSKLLLREEIRVAQLVKDASNGKTLSGTGTTAANKWSGNGGDPMAVKSEMLKNMWFEPNTLVLSYDVYTALKNNPRIIGALSSNDKKVVKKEDLQNLFEVENLLIATSRVAGEKPQKGEVSATRIWNGLCVFAYVSQEIDMPTAGKIFVEHQSDTDTEGFFVTTWFEPNRGVKGKDMVKVALVSEEKIVAPDCLYVVKDCV